MVFPWFPPRLFSIVTFALIYLKTVVLNMWAMTPLRATQPFTGVIYQRLHYDSYQQQNYSYEIATIRLELLRKKK